jgi:hypothetical protein
VKPRNLPYLFTLRRAETFQILSGKLGGVSSEMAASGRDSLLLANGFPVFDTTWNDFS